MIHVGTFGQLIYVRIIATNIELYMRIIYRVLLPMGEGYASILFWSCLYPEGLVL
jgi:hypothetical protein